MKLLLDSARRKGGVRIDEVFREELKAERRADFQKILLRAKRCIGSIDAEYVIFFNGGALSGPVCPMVKSRTKWARRGQLFEQSLASPLEKTNKTGL